MEVFEGNFSDNSDEEDFQEEYTNDVVSKELDINEFYKNYEENKKKFKTSSVLSKYEKTRIISERVQQISNGGVPFISNPESYPTLHDIALKELSMKKLPFIIKRTIHGNNYELWKLEDLRIIN
jgi:DNA-directed RNA polymerase subunit K/omega